jgi:hypothetical protein
VEIYFSAFLFHKTVRVPVKEGATLILIPVHIKSGSPTIGGEAVTVGSYLYVKRDVTVEPSFSCFAVLAEWVPVTMPFSYRICCGIASNL